MAKAVVEDEVLCRVSKLTKGGLELSLLLKFDEVNFEEAESFDISEVGEPFENALALVLYGGE